MTLTFHLDSSYVRLIFLVVTELLLVRVVISSQLRSLDREVKRRLDNGESVELDIKEYGPLKITSEMGFSRVALIILPAAFILAMVAFGELGISGRTVPMYSDQETITAGGYFSLDSVSASFTDRIFSRSPIELSGTWRNCIDYNNDSVIGHEATTSYKIEDGVSEVGNTICSTEVGVVVSDMRTQCSKQYWLGSEYKEGEFFSYEITEIGEKIYYKESRLNIFGVCYGSRIVD